MSDVSIRDGEASGVLRAGLRSGQRTPVAFVCDYYDQS